MTAAGSVRTPRRSPALHRYDRVAAKSARLVLREYSTSFGAASRLLARGMRPHIANIYGLVRLGDEIVDGPAESAGLDLDARARLLDALEGEVEAALDRGYSANLLVHAFALSAGRYGIDTRLTRPFFASMRADLTLTHCTPAEFERYVYGSAEVVGLMCLRVFVGGRQVAPDRLARLELGARRLGAAFQKINFLRDLGEDVRLLGRSYFPSVRDGRLDERGKREIIASIRDDLACARGTLRELPRGARTAVRAALVLFEELADRIEGTPARLVIARRIRVPDLVKARIVTAAVLHEAGARR